MSGFVTVLITFVHIAACVSLVVAILLQSGKGGGLAGAFGAGSSQTLFGGRGAATFLSRAATTLAVIFFLTSLTLGLASVRQGGTASHSLIQEEARKRAEQRGATEQTPPPSQGQPPIGGAPAPGTGLGPGPGTATTQPAGPTSPAAPSQPVPGGPLTPQGNGSK